MSLIPPKALQGGLIGSLNIKLFDQWIAGSFFSLLLFTLAEKKFIGRVLSFIPVAVTEAI